MRDYVSRRGARSRFFIRGEVMAQRRLMSRTDAPPARTAPRRKRLVVMPGIRRARAVISITHPGRAYRSQSSSRARHAAAIFT